MRPRCPRCGWTFYGNPVPAAVAVIADGDRVLLTRRARDPYAGTWDLAGGFLEAGETPEAAVVRELREELGVAASRPTLIGFATDRYGPRGMPVLTIVYLVAAPAGRIRPADDVAEARWFARARIPYERIAFPGLRRLLRQWVEAAERESRRRNEKGKERRGRSRRGEGPRAGGSISGR